MDIRCVLTTHELKVMIYKGSREIMLYGKTNQYDFDAYEYILLLYAANKHTHTHTRTHNAARFTLVLCGAHGCHGIIGPLFLSFGQAEGFSVR